MRSLAAAGFEVVAAARRLERCEEVAREVGGRALRLDVTDPDSVAEARGGAAGALGARQQRRRARSGWSRSRRQTRRTGAGCTSPT